MKKRVLSFVFVLTMLVGLFSGIGESVFQAAEKEITIGFNCEADGHFYFSASNYDFETLKWYRLDTIEVNGKEQTNTVFIEFADKDTIAIYAPYWDAEKPTTSFRIPAGTKAQASDQSNPWVSDPNGEIITITNELYIVNENGTWKAAEAPKPDEAKKEITIGFNCEADGHFYFSASNYDFETLKWYRLDTIEVDGQEQTNTVFIEFADKDTIAIYAPYWDAGKPTTSFRIPAGTKAQASDQSNPWVSDPNGEIITITNELYIVNENGTWKVSEAPNPGTPDEPEKPEEVKEITFDFASFTDGNMILIPKGLPSKTATFYQVAAVVDGKETKIWLEINPAWDLGHSYIYQFAGTQSLEIAAGAVLTEFDAAGTGEPVPNGKQLKLKQELRLVCENGNWKLVEEEMEEVIFDFVSGNENNDLSFLTSLLPKEYADCYQFEALVDGIEKTLLIEFSKARSNDVKAYIIGLEANEKLVIPTGTVFREYDKETQTVVEGGKKMKTAAEIRILKKDNAWKSNSADVELGLDIYDKASNAFIFKTDLGNAALKNFFGLTAGTNPVADLIKIKIDGEEHKAIFTLAEGGQIAYWTDVPAYDSISTIEIPAGTTLTFNGYEQMIKIKNTLKLKKHEGTWVLDSGNEVKVTDAVVDTYEMYPMKDRGFVQLILRTDINLNTDFAASSFAGEIVLGGVVTPVTWWVEDGLIYTVDISYADFEKADKLVVAADTLISLSADPNQKVKLAKGLKLTKIDGIWMIDNGQTKIDYNEIKLTFSSFDGKGFYLGAEIVAGPDKGKTVSEVYGDWVTSAVGGMIYNGTESMDVYYSLNGSFAYVSGDYDISKISTITFKKDTILTPMAGASCTTMLKIANDLELAYDARFHVWGLASDLNKEYNYRDVYVSVSSISGVEFWLDAKFVKNPNQAIMDVYGDWSLLNGEIILGDPAKGETSLVTTYTSAGTFLILYGISPGLMDSIEIPAGTILWPDASCKSADPIRIANDIKLVRDEEDDWKIVAGAQMPEIEVPDTPGEDEKPDNGEQTPDNGEQTPEGGNNNGESSDSGYVTKVNLLTKKENGKPSDSASAQGSVLPIIGIVSVVLLVTAGAALLVLVGLKKKGAKPSQK